MPRTCLGKEELQNLVRALGRWGGVFNHKHFLLKSYIVAFKCLGYILTSKGTQGIY